MTMSDLLQALGDEIEDPDEETFSLYSQSFQGNNNLGMVDGKQETLELTIDGRNLTIRQSPSMLRSDRERGTTGSVVWKVTPFFAEWITSSENLLSRTGILSNRATALELGCGISGIVALAVAPRISRYIATDQDYVLKILNQNIINNKQELPQDRRMRASGVRHKPKPLQRKSESGTITTMAVDWELNVISDLPALLRRHDDSVSNDEAVGVDCVIACDCIYNEALLEPFVDTCAAICALRPASTDFTPTVCVMAQQLRSPDVFGEWLGMFHRKFRVWRLEPQQSTPDMQGNSGFVVHIGILRDEGLK